MDPFLTAATHILDQACSDMRACVDSMSGEALNWRPAGDETNSIAVLAVHSLHSTRTWLSIATDAPRPDRNRDAEFVATAADGTKLAAFIDELHGDCVGLLKGDGAVDWSALRQAHGRPGSAEERRVSAAWALTHALEHLREHVGVMMLTRQLWDVRS